MTWLAFKTLVTDLLHSDGARLGSESFVSGQIRQAVIDLQGPIEAYRTRHQNTYLEANVTARGSASEITLPDFSMVQDAWFIRTRLDATLDLLTGTTTASSSTTITGDGTLFTTELAVGDRIQVGTLIGTYPTGTVTSIVSDTELTVDAATGDGDAQSIWKEKLMRYPVAVIPWDRRFELSGSKACLNDSSAQGAISPDGSLLWITPSVTDPDADDYARSVEVNWDGIKSDFVDADEVPFDEGAAGAAADWVKGECARQLNHDMQEWATFLDENRGSYFRKRRQLYRNGLNRGRVK